MPPPKKGSGNCRLGGEDRKESLSHSNKRLSFENKRLFFIYFFVKSLKNFSKFFFRFIDILVGINYNIIVDNKRRCCLVGQKKTRPPFFRKPEVGEADRPY
jgi:hypothetical protein